MCAVDLPKTRSTLGCNRNVLQKARRAARSETAIFEIDCGVIELNVSRATLHCQIETSRVSVTGDLSVKNDAPCGIQDERPVIAGTRVFEVGSQRDVAVLGGGATTDGRHRNGCPCIERPLDFVYANLRARCRWAERRCGCCVGNAVARNDLYVERVDQPSTANAGIRCANNIKMARGGGFNKAASLPPGAEDTAHVRASI